MTKRFATANAAILVLLSLIIVGTVAVASTLVGSTVRLSPLSITHISDGSLPSEVQATESETLAFAFDRDAGTWSSPTEVVLRYV